VETSVTPARTMSPALRAAAFLLAAAAAFGQPSPGPGEARVVSLTGTLTLQRPREAPRTLQVNATVLPGDELITGENSYAVIQTATGAKVEIFPDSRVIFNEQSPDIREFLHLFFGSIKVYIEKITGRPNPHKITTPTAVIAVRGTIFSVFVDDADSTLVAVEEGVVAVANRRFPQQEVILRAGERTWIHEGSPPMAAERFQGPSERADLLPPRRPGQAAPAMQPAMRRGWEDMDHRMERSSGARSMGSMPGHSPMRE